MALRRMGLRLRNKKKILRNFRYITVGQRDETIAKETVFRQQLIIYGFARYHFNNCCNIIFCCKDAWTVGSPVSYLALKSLRSQMNPSFIFNALNSVKSFHCSARWTHGQQISCWIFTMMRLVLENSQEDFIKLDEDGVYGLGVARSLALSLNMKLSWMKLSTPNP